MKKSTIIIIVIVSVLLVAGGLTTFFIIRNKRKNNADDSDDDGILHETLPGLMDEALVNPGFENWLNDQNLSGFDHRSIMAQPFPQYPAQSVQNYYPSPAYPAPPAPLYTPPVTTPVNPSVNTSVSAGVGKGDVINPISFGIPAANRNTMGKMAGLQRPVTSVGPSKIPAVFGKK